MPTMPMTSMRDLLVHQLRSLYRAEQMLVNALPAMVSAANAPLLVAALVSHFRQTETHVSRLETCFALMGEDVRSTDCKGMEGLLSEGEEMAEGGAWHPFVRDAGLIGAAQRVEHYEIAAYGTCAELATMLGEDAVAKLLRTTLEEERSTNLRLNSIAHTDVNPKAMLSADRMAIR